MNLSRSEPAFRLHRGSRPVLISMPHVGTYLPADLKERLTDEAQGVPDTDWHLDRLYDFAHALGASVLMATHSRYVIDLNRPPDGASLYPGQSVTGLCPVDTFDHTPLYRDDSLRPTDAEITQRRDAFWRPYHAQLSAELSRLKHEHGTVALWDAHSIRSVLPRFFEGRLPDFNFGTADATSCEPVLAERVLAICQQTPAHTAVLNGRFKGGYITRHYGNPGLGIHAIQLELAQCVYMAEQTPFEYLPDRAVQIQPTLKNMLEAVLEFVEAQPA